MPEQDLDTRIRQLVARAVADAPPAPELDPASVVLDHPRRDGRRGWWVGGGAALLAAAAAITTVALIADTDDRISTPNSEPTTPVTTSIPSSTTTAAPSTTVADPAADPIVLTAGEGGVVEYRGDTPRTLTTDPTNIALAAPDGRIVVQRYGGEGDVDEPLVLDPADGSTTELLPNPEYWDGLALLHDIELVGDRQLLLYSILGGTDRPETDTQRVFVVDLATAERVELLDTPGSVDRLTLAPNGLAVGTRTDETGVSFLALAVPGSPAAASPLPTAEQLGLQATYADCDVECPRMFTVLPDGRSFAWTEGFDEGAEIVVATIGDPEPERIPLPFPPQGSGLDVAADGSFLLARAPAPVTVMRVGRDGSAIELEGTIATAGPTGSTQPPPPAVPPFEVTDPGVVAAAGPEGVVLRLLSGDLIGGRDEPARIALPVGDGHVVVQQADEPPTMWSVGLVSEAPLATIDWPGPVTVHDVAIVDGRPLLLHVPSGPAQGGFVDVVDLETGGFDQVSDLPGPLRPGSRLHLAANGLVVGELTTGQFVTAIRGSRGQALVGQLSEQALGSDPGSTPLLTVSPDGSWVAWLEGGELVEVDVSADGLGEQRRWALPFDTTGAVDVDVLAEGVIVNFGSGQDARYALRDGSFGVLEGPLATQGPGTLDAEAAAADPVPTTTTTAPPAADPAGTMVTAGADGVAVIDDSGVELRRIDQPAEVAFLTPGGAVIFQPPRPDPASEPGDPLIWRPDGTVERLLGELGELQSYRLYDVADVAGVPTVLYGLRSVSAESPPNGTATQDFTEVVNVLSMTPGSWTTTELDRMNTWEAGYSHLSLSETGSVLGEKHELVTRGLFATAIPGSPGANDIPDAATFGVEAEYTECTDCPGNYAISADSQTVAWLDAGDVVVFDAATGETRRFQHPALAGSPARLDIRATDAGTYEVIIDMWSSADATPIDPVRLRLTGEEGSELPLDADFVSFGP